MAGGKHQNTRSGVINVVHVERDSNLLAKKQDNSSLNLEIKKKIR